MRYSCSLVMIAMLLMPVAVSAENTEDSSALARQVVVLAVEPGIDARIDRMIGDAAAKQPADKQHQVRTDLAKAAAPIRDDLINVFVRYYAQSFTTAELKGLVDFYKGPLGAKALSVEQKKPAEVDAAITQQIMKVVKLLPPPGPQQ